MVKHTRLFGLTAAFALTASAAMADSIAPETFEATLGVGDSVTINKTVTVVEGRPTGALVDVFFLSDTTGSMGGIIDAVRTNAAQILAGTASLGEVAWGVGEYKDFRVAGTSWGSSGDFPWRLNQAVTIDTDAVQDGIDQWGASGGNDGPESNLHGLTQAVTGDPAVGWRDGAKRIIVWFGDAPGHDPLSCAAQSLACTNPATAGYPGSTLTDTIAAMTGSNTTVIGVSGNTGFYSAGINQTGQAALITAATGGSLLGISSDPGDAIVEIIKDAIDEVFATYTTVSLNPVGVPAGVGVSVSDPIVGIFDREETRTFDFTVTFTGLAPGVHDFTIDALVDGVRVATEKDRITVTGEPGVIPLPAAGWLLLGGLGALGALSRRRKAA
jgi:hypothetical protein